MSIERKPNKWMKGALIKPIRTFIEHRSKIVIERNDTKQLVPPYIILANHVNNWDPLFINSYVDEPICFVASDSLFRNPLLKKVLNWTGAIPKTKFKNDTSTIRAILKAKKHKRVIAIFPEGNRNWDGNTEPIIYTTTKLVKSLNIPVVVATIRGGHLSHPRWADGHRKGLISMSFTKILDKEDLAKESVDSLHKKLINALAHDEMAWQEKNMTPYKGKNLANFLERLLFVCPHCETPGKLRSEGDLFACSQCSFSVRYTSFGTFERGDLPLYYSTPREWNVWQLEYMKQTFFSPDKKKQWDEAMQDHIKLSVSDGENPFELITAGSVQWNTDSLYFKGDNEEIYQFPFSELDGVNIQMHHYLDFYREGNFYRMTFYQPHTSAYKWIKAMHLVMELSEKEEVE